MADLQPMKGLHILLNQDVLDFLWECRKEIDDVYSDELNEQNPSQVLVKLGAIGWARVKDKFGDKAYKERPYPASSPPRPNDVLRVTVICRKGALFIDIRPWGEY